MLKKTNFLKSKKQKRHRRYWKKNKGNWKNEKL